MAAPDRVLIDTSALSGQDGRVAQAGALTLSSSFQFAR